MIKTVFGRPIRGEKKRVHIFYRLFSSTTAERYPVKIDMYQQIAFNCETKLDEKRTVYSRSLFRGQITEEGVEAWETAEPSKVVEYIEKHCNVPDSHEWIGDLLVNTQNVLTNGEKVNLSITKTGSKERAVFTLNCTEMTFGLGEQPNQAIRPGSNASLFYQRFCR